MWTCQRQQNKTRCKHENPNRRQLCERCGKRRPPRKPPAHRKALELPYEEYVRINGGEFCGICGTTDPGKLGVFHRDHEHRGEGRARGLLCFPCNLQLKHTSTVEWLEAAAAYLRRSTL